MGHRGPVVPESSIRARGLGRRVRLAGGKREVAGRIAGRAAGGPRDGCGESDRRGERASFCVSLAVAGPDVPRRLGVRPRHRGGSGIRGCESRRDRGTVPRRSAIQRHRLRLRSGRCDVPDHRWTRIAVRALSRAVDRGERRGAGRIRLDGVARDRASAFDRGIASRPGSA